MSKIYQDWKPVVLTKHQPIKKNLIYNKQIIEDNNEIVVPKTVTKEYGLKVQQYRNVMNLNQKDLAQKLNIPLEQIRNIENGTALKNGTLITKINRFLKITNKL